MVQYSLCVVVVQSLILLASKSVLKHNLKMWESSHGKSNLLQFTKVLEIKLKRNHVKIIKSLRI